MYFQLTVLKQVGPSFYFGTKLEGKLLKMSDCWKHQNSERLCKVSIILNGKKLDLLLLSLLSYLYIYSYIYKHVYIYISVCIKRSGLSTQYKLLPSNLLIQLQRWICPIKQDPNNGKCTIYQENFYSGRNFIISKLKLGSLIFNSAGGNLIFKDWRVLSVLVTGKTNVKICKLS